MFANIRIFSFKVSFHVQLPIPSTNKQEVVETPGRGSSPKVVTKRYKKNQKVTSLPIQRACCLVKEAKQTGNNCWIDTHMQVQTQRGPQDSSSPTSSFKRWKNQTLALFSNLGELTQQISSKAGGEPRTHNSQSGGSLRQDWKKKRSCG